MLGIIDWGIGGTSIYKLLKERCPELSVLYLSDTGVTPYGKMSRAELIARLNSVIRFLISQEVTHLVIGCNAASTALDKIDSQGINVIGMIESGVSAAVKRKPKSLGLIGGRRTVVSGVYRRAFAGKDVKVNQRIAQPLSALIETGDTDSEALMSECERILAPIRNSSHILMACTHYPAIEATMKKFVSPSTIFIDPAFELARKVDAWKLKGNGQIRFTTTGDPTGMRNAAKAAFGVTIADVEKVKI